MMVVVVLLLHWMVVVTAGKAADLVGGAEVVAAVALQVVVGTEASVGRRGASFRWSAERERGVVGIVEAVVRRWRRRRELMVDARKVVLVVKREVLNRVGVVVEPGPCGSSSAADTAGQVLVGVVAVMRVRVVVARVGAAVVRMVEGRSRIHSGENGKEVKVGSIDPGSGIAALIRRRGALGLGRGEFGSGRIACSVGAMRACGGGGGVYRVRLLAAAGRPDRPASPARDAGGLRESRPGLDGGSVAGGSDVPFSVRPDRESAACGDVCDEVPAGRPVDTIARGKPKMNRCRTTWPACHLRLTFGPVGGI
jgi:hypothetical protein